MTAPESPATLREELTAIDAQIDELQRNADDLRKDLAETSDKTASIEAAEQQEVLISQLDLRRRELMERLETA
jgi:prefoldin subunit 5